jgi:hypothetical protein
MLVFSDESKQKRNSYGFCTLLIGRQWILVCITSPKLYIWQSRVIVPAPPPAHPGPTCSPCAGHHNRPQAYSQLLWRACRSSTAPRCSLLTLKRSTGHVRTTQSVSSKGRWGEQRYAGSRGCTNFLYKDSLASAGFWNSVALAILQQVESNTKKRRFRPVQQHAVQ